MPHSQGGRNRRQLGWEREHGLRSDSPDTGLRVWVGPCGPQGCAPLCAGLSFGEALGRLTPENFPDLSQVRTLQWQFPSFWYFIQTQLVSWVSEGSTAWKQVEKETFRLFPVWIHWYVLGFHHAAELPRQPMTQHIREYFSCENMPVHSSSVTLTRVLAF